MNTRWLDPDMGTRFAKADWQPIELDGRIVHPMLRLPVRTGDRISIQWLSASTARAQGLALRLRDPNVAGSKGRAGMLRVGGVDSPAIALWMETAPNPSTIEVVKVGRGGQLQISNQWRNPGGWVDEWFQNYGMLVEDRGDDEYLLRMSDGLHPAGPEFDDQVVRVSWLHA